MLTLARNLPDAYANGIIGRAGTHASSRPGRYGVHSTSPRWQIEATSPR